MGDNVYLGDRDGVRTPMQWSADRNAGFSTANPQKLYLPVIIDPGVQLRDGQRRRAARQPGVAAVVGAPADRVAQALSGLRPRIDRAAVARQPPRARVPPARRSAAPDDGPTEPAGARRREPVAASAVRRARPLRVPRHAARRAVRPDDVPADRRAALPADARAARVLLARARADPRRAPAPRSTRCCRRSSRPGRGTRCSHRDHRGRLDAVLPAPPARPPLVRGQGPARHRRRASSTSPRSRCRSCGARTKSCRRPGPARSRSSRSSTSTASPRPTCSPSSFVPGVAGERFIEDHPGRRARARRTADRTKRACSSTRTGCPATGARVMSTLARRRRIRTELGSVAGVPGRRARRER